MLERIRDGIEGLVERAATWSKLAFTAGITAKLSG
jgi:hypothetical protein